MLRVRHGGFNLGPDHSGRLDDGIGDQQITGTAFTPLLGGTARLTLGFGIGLER